MSTNPKRPTDVSQRAKAIVDLATRERASGEPAEIMQVEAKNPAAVQLGRLGGLKGGKAMAAGVMDRVWEISDIVSLID